MAFKLRYWLGAVAAGCILAAAFLVPPSPWVPRSPEQPSVQEGVRYRALLSQVGADRELLKRMRWADSLTALAVRTATGGVAVGAPEGVGAPVLEHFRAGVVQEVATIPARRADVVLGVFVQRADVQDYAGDAGQPPGGFVRLPEYYLGSADGRTTCLAVRPVPGNSISDRSLVWAVWSPFAETRGATLGPCRLVARYGAPAGPILRWLKDGGLVFTQEPPGAEAPEMPPWMFRRRSLFGIRNVWFGGDPTYDGCLAARPEACARFLTAPIRRVALRRAVDASDLIGRMDYMGGGYPGTWWRLLADVEADFGAERFGAFWTSDADVLTAFQRAFGVDAGRWTAEWVKANLGDVPPGPRPGLASALGSLLVVLLGAGAAVGLGVRRTVA